MTDPEFKVYGLVFSPPTRVVMIYMKVVGIPYEFVLVDLFGYKHYSKEFRAINPNCTVPALGHGEYSIGESAAIVQYVSEFKGLSNDWWPGDIRERAKVLSSLHWHHGIAHKLAGFVFKTVVEPNFLGEHLSEEEFKFLKSECDGGFLALDKMLNDGKCIAGNKTPSAADVICFPYVEHCVVCANYDLTPYPNVQAWFERLRDMDGFRDVHQEFIQANQAMQSNSIG